MINRELIRVKIVQLTYAYYQNGNNNIDAAEKELVFSLSKAYDLYNYMLSLMVAVTKEARDYCNVIERKARRERTESPSTRFADNRFILQLENNRMLNEFIENKKMSWDSHVEYVKKLFQRIKDAQFFKDYLDNKDDSYELDKDVWRKIYKAFIMDNDELDEILEDESLYWNDDKDIVDTFVIKTIKRFEEKNGVKQPLLPEYDSEEDREAVHDLAYLLQDIGERVRQEVCLHGDRVECIEDGDAHDERQEVHGIVMHELAHVAEGKLSEHRRPLPGLLRPA